MPPRQLSMKSPATKQRAEFCARVSASERPTRSCICQATTLKQCSFIAGLPRRSNAPGVFRVSRRLAAFSTRQRSMACRLLETAAGHLPTSPHLHHSFLKARREATPSRKSSRTRSSRMLDSQKSAEKTWRLPRHLSITQRQSFAPGDGSVFASM
jgi:hypothetical protein